MFSRFKSFLFPEKSDPPKPVLDASPDDCHYEIFSDCRSEPDQILPGESHGVEHRQDVCNPRHGEAVAAVAATGGGEEFAQVTVSDPHRVGEGISSYMVYRVSTR